MYVNPAKKFIKKTFNIALWRSYHQGHKLQALRILIKIESQKGVENAEQIIANEHVDGEIFGPGDLAASMGFHGGWQHPEVLSAMESVIEIALA